jgi:hypothetical protein
MNLTAFKQCSSVLQEEEEINSRKEINVVARQGFEPQYADPKSAVLPLDDRANR